MYVLCCPCILTPELRAKGITKPSDLELFEHAIERCRKFNIDIVPLPCPETLYLGPDRSPGTFLERLNTRGFTCMLEVLEARVKEIIKQRGSPLCILGVNSSPTCGVTKTFYGREGAAPPQREGRGVFLSRFPDTRAMDVAEFARYRIYLAAPLFSEAERSYNVMVADLLRTHFFDVYLPQDIGDNISDRDREKNKPIFERNITALQNVDIVVAIIDGADADSGTAWEMGYATALKKPVIALRTDFRKAGHFEWANLMLEQSATLVTNKEDLVVALKAPLIDVPPQRKTRYLELNKK